MTLWLLIGIALLLFAWNFRERFADSIVPPVLDDAGRIPASWQSKIDAQAPIGGTEMDMLYFKQIQAFYTTVYERKPEKPTEEDVEAFLKTANVEGIDVNALRKVLAQGFRIESGVPAAEREKTQLVTSGALAGFEGKNLQVGNARDEVYTRTESAYQPSDTRKAGELPEGLYEPVNQQETPRRPGDYGSGLKGFYQVCDPSTDEVCAKNVS